MTKQEIIIHLSTHLASAIVDVVNQEVSSEIKAQSLNGLIHLTAHQINQITYHPNPDLDIFDVIAFFEKTNQSPIPLAFLKDQRSYFQNL